MLKDLELLVLSIKKEYIREYMNEAMNCYNAKSYRACIILSTIAGMHDLREKIKDLSSSIKDIRELDTEIEKRISSESSYENYMVEQAAYLSILSTPEVESIKAYMALRNRSAHPNDYIATAEEARMVFTGYYNNIINKPSLLGPAYIKVISERLENQIFFPDFEVDNVKRVVQEELGRLHKNSTIPLANSLIKTLEDPALVGSVKWKNASTFFAFLFNEINDEAIINGISQKLSRIIENEALFNSLLVSSFLFPKLVSYLAPTDRQRFIAHFKAIIKSDSHILRIKLIHVLFTEGILIQEEQDLILNTFMEKIKDSHKIISERTDRSSVIELGEWVDKVVEMNILQIDSSFFDTLIKLVQDNDYNVVNDALGLLNRLEKNFLNRIEDKQLTDLFIAIMKQAHGPGRGADEARKIWREGFLTYNEQANKFIGYITSDFEKYDKYIQSIHPGELLLIQLLDKLNLHGHMMNVLHVIKEQYKDSLENLEIEINYYRRLLEKEENIKWNDIISKLDEFLVNP